MPSPSERTGDGRVVSGFWDGLPVRSNPWAGENPRVLAEIRTRMFGLSPMPDGPPDARIAAQIGRTLVEGMSGYAAFYRQGQARVSVYALRSADPPQWMRPSPVRRDDSAGRAIARLSSSQGAVLAVGDPGPCFASLERHLRSVVSTSAALQTTSPVSLLLDRVYVRDVQIEPDGRQPRELERTRSWHYSEFNLAAFMDLATLGAHVGVDLWNYRTPDGRGIRQAVDFLVPYAAGARKWAFDQITPFSASTMHTILRRGAVVWKEPKYRALADRVGGGPRLVLTIP